MKPSIEIRSLFAIMAAVLVFSIGLFFWTVKRVTALNAETRQYNTATSDLHLLLSWLKDAETGQRGFLLTHREEYLRPYDESLAKVRTSLREVERMAGEGIVTADEAANVRQKVELKLEELASTLVLSRKGDVAGALRLVNEDTGRHLLDDVRLQVGLLSQKTSDHARATTSRAASAARFRDLALLACLGLNLGFLWWAYRKIDAGIQQREKASEEIWRRGQILATTLSSIGDAVILTDTDGNITFMNRVAENLTGWTQEEAAGRPCADVFNIINESSREPVPSPVEKVIQTGLIVGLANHTLLIRKDRSEVPIDDSGAPIMEASGVLHGVVLVFRDFSEYKAAEATLRHAKEEVERASEAKDLFLAALSHELRTPLAPVMAILSAWDGEEEFPEKFRSELKMIHRNVVLEARLIDDLLDLVRVNRGTLSMRTERLSVNDLVEATLKMYEGEIASKSLKAIVQLGAAEPNVTGDPARLQQVLWNVVGNAVKFTPEGGSVTVETLNPAPGKVAIRVSDTGIGISAETRAHLFDSFYQGSDERRRKFGGLGLGMSISRKLITQHDGTITAESPGLALGSTFTVTLPVAGLDGVEAPLLAPLGADHSGMPLMKLLLLEDHRDTAAALSSLLTKRGHKVRVEGTIARGVMAMREEPFDLIISDIGLPDGTGVEFIRTVREFSKAPAIALSGHGMEDDIEACLQAGFHSHLTKPVSVEQLRQEIARVRNAVG